MKNNDLFHQLVNARSDKKNFCSMFKTISNFCDQEKMRKAKELEDDGYITLSECKMEYFEDLKEMVKLKGVFTPKGLELIKEKGI